MTDLESDDVTVKERAINWIVTDLETMPRNNWHSFVNKLARRIETDLSKSLHDKLIKYHVDVNRAHEKLLTDFSVKADEIFASTLAIEKAEFQKLLGGNHFLPQLTALFVSLSTEEYSRSKKEEVSKSNLLHQEMAQKFNNAIKTINKEKWQTASLREEFVTSVMAMAHGGEVGPILEKYLSGLNVILKDVCRCVDKYIKEEL
jgi:hypothetical protein